MSDMAITATGPGAFEVRLADGGGERSYRVTVPDELVDELGLPADDLERVVRTSFEFLLEREPAASIMPEFSLDVISRYFPEYRQELARRIA
jgi:hypothetical protein